MFSNGNSRIRKRRKALRQLEELTQTPESTLLIHYSCESFIDNTRVSNRTTSIAVRYMESGQSHSFSIHQVAEELGVPKDQIPTRYDEIERKLLQAFFQFVREHQNFRWVHWNMRDINYGFLALEHRSKVLGDTPSYIPDLKKFDLSRLLIDLYGPSYIGHPRLETLLEKNEMTTKDFLSGPEEAEAFKKGDYAKLHRSTLRKCDLMETVLECAANDTLKVDASFLEKYGISPEIVGYFVREHWFFSILTFGFAIFGFVVACRDFMKWISTNN